MDKPKKIMKNFEEKFDKLIPIGENAPRVEIIKSPDGQASLMRFGKVVISVPLNSNTTTGGLTNEV